MKLELHRIPKIAIIPSAAYGLGPKHFKYYTISDKAPEHGDVIYGQIERIGQHQTIESKTGRIHHVYSGDKNIFVFGNRYAPDYYEAMIPDKIINFVDLVSRSGVVSKMVNKNNKIKDPTRIKVLGYICDSDGNILNTTNNPAVTPKSMIKKPRRSKMIVFVGTSMNSGKSFAAAAAVKALVQAGHTVRASKITGTASLKDILSMSDAGAEIVSDFTFLGHPSTYMLDKSTILSIFDKLDLKYANKPSNYWVVEIADGIIQRETAMLLENKAFQDRIHKIIFCASDALGAIGGKRLLKDKFGIKINMISGLCTATPLHIREMRSFTDLPIFVSAQPTASQIEYLL
jgi:hypothetical protein